MRKLTTVTGLVLILTLGLVASLARPQPARAANDSVVVTWNQEILESIVATKTPPTIAARALAVVHTAVYDAWTAYDPVAVPTLDNGNGRQPSAERTLDNKTKAVSWAAYRVLRDLFPTTRFPDLDTKVDYDGQMAKLFGTAWASDASAARTVGENAAAAVITYRHHDGANQLGDEQGTPPEQAGTPYADYIGYTPVNDWNTPLDEIDPDHWQPLCVLTDTGVQNAMPSTPPAGNNCDPPYYKKQTFLTPFWAKVTPFALTSPSQFRAPGPYTYLGPDGKPSGKYVDEVDKMTQYSKQLDDFRKTTAEYWEDGPGSVTPPGHWNQFAQWVARRDANTVDEDARMFFALNNALLDASISAWDGKRNWDSIRPICAVRWLQRGKIIQAWGGPYKGPSYIKGEDWIPYRPPTDPAPPFAEYASGHSTFSMAAAEVLTAFTGRGNFELKWTIKAGSSKVEPKTATQPGVPAKDITLSWTNFRYAAEQAGLSRQYGGIHFEHGDKDARAAGAKVGKNAWAKALTYFNGTAT
jgi:hypothetical protein